MKVLKHGREQHGWSITKKCTGDGNEGGGCGAKLLIEAHDLFHTHRYVHVEHDVFTTFKCSVCGVLTDIKDRIPSYVSNDIPNDYQAWLKRQGATLKVPIKGVWEREWEGERQLVELEQGRYNLVVEVEDHVGVDSTDH